MKKVLLLFFGCALGSEIALAESELNIVDLPVGCFQHQTPCALTFVKGGKTKIHEIEVAFSPGASVLIREQEIELLSGKMWSDQFEDTRIRHGVVSAALTGDVLLEKSDDQLSIINLNGVVQVSGGRKTAEPIPSGFQNWYRGLGQRGEFIQGVLEPVRPEDFLSTWVGLSQFSLSEAQERASTYAKNRKVAVEESAKLYHDILQMRRIAAEEQDRRVQIANAKRQQEQQHFKKMMRNRLFQPD